MIHLGRTVVVLSLLLAGATQTGTFAQRPSPDGPAVPGRAAPTLPILQSELQRNFDVLRKSATPAYFIGYTVHDEHTVQVTASVGALDRTDDSRGRFGTVEVRVGDYTLDNTHPIRGEGGGGAPRVGRISLPLTDEEAPVKLALWRATDRAFKLATEQLTRVRTNVAAKVVEEDPAPDFSREKPQTYAGPPVTLSIDPRVWEARTRRLSAPFAEDPQIFSGTVSLTARASNRYYTNSEGTQLATGDVQYRLFIQAATKAADGMELPLYNSYFARTLDGLPDEKKLLADVRDMMDLLARLRRAPLVDPYSGPAILSGRAAGVFFHEIFGHRVEGHRQRNADDGQTFGRKVNEAVLPPFLNVVFDPTAKTRGSVELMGYYQYDDEGVQARRVTVVDKGLLQTFLLGRAPIRTFAQSNGHGRGEPGLVPVSRQSNLIVESSRTVSSAALVQQLKDEAKKQGKPFGLLFDDISGGFTTTGRGNPNAFNVTPNVVYRIYTDDRAPELVRGVDLIGTPLAAFAKIIGASDRIGIFNGVCGAESGSVPVSASSPELLVSEVEVQKKQQSQEALPILPAPSRTTRGTF
jgi:TldD protein